MPPKKSRLRPLTLMAAAAVGMTVLASCGTTASPSPPPTALGSPSPPSACAWPIEDSYLTSNSGLPDTAAWYWGQSFTVHPGTQVVVAGAYPDARYASFTVYSSSELPFTSNGVVSSLADFQIAPDAGSANPWRRVAAPGGHFTLKLRMQVSPGQANVLPLAPAGVTSGVGYLEYRVYLPATGRRITHRLASHNSRERWVDPAAPGLHLAHHSDPPTRSPDHYDSSTRPQLPAAPAASLRLSSSGPRSRPTSQILRPATWWPT